MKGKITLKNNPFGIPYIYFNISGTVSLFNVISAFVGYLMSTPSFLLDAHLVILQAGPDNPILQ